MRKTLLLSSLAIAALLPQPAQAVTVLGTANPFLAGHPNGTTCCAGALPDVVPANSPVLAASGALGGQTFTFTATGGADNTPFNGGTTPDGFGPFNMVADYGTGISGAKGVGLAGLMGVFLGPGVPFGAAPGQLDFTGALNFSSLSPGLNQIFFIGDGLTGTGLGSLQQFLAPAGATRLFLGVSDGFEWNNNSGRIEVSLQQAGSVPEPASWALMLAGFGLIGGAMRRTKGPRNARRVTFG